MTLLVLIGALLAAPVQANPLGIQNGDLITSIEWDAIQGDTGEGMFTNSTSSFDINGAVSSTTVTGPTTYINSNVSLSAHLKLKSETLNLDNTPIVQVNVAFESPGLNPDVVIKENGINILLGNFVGNLLALGNLNLNDSGSVFTAVGTISITGGNGQLVNALGGMGGNANLLLTAALFDFNPGPNVTLADNILFNSNFNMSLSGTLIPLAPAPFVPEPSTALMFGGGLVGMLGMARRAKTRRG